MSRRVGIVLTVAVTAAIVTPAQTRTVSAAQPQLKAAHFTPAAGWRVHEGVVRACPGVSAARCSYVASAASTTRLRDCLVCLPHQTAAAMAPGDILIAITVSVEHPPRVARSFAWPPHLTRRQVHSPLEGLPARIGGYQGTTRVGTREVFVMVFFGRANPTDRQLHRANAELRRARIG